MLEQKNQNSEIKNKKAPKDFVKYSAIGFQMIAITLIGTLGGMNLDQRVTEIKIPVYSCIFSNKCCFYYLLRFTLLSCQKYESI